MKTTLQIPEQFLDSDFDLEGWLEGELVAALKREQEEHERRLLEGDGDSSGAPPVGILNAKGLVN